MTRSSDNKTDLDVTSPSNQEPQTSTEILIDGRLYDCSGFQHPGGGIIKFHLGGGDATEAFNEFHHRSTKAWKVLKLLPNRVAPVNSRDSAGETVRLAKLSKSFMSLRNDLIKQGLFEPNNLIATWRIIELVLMLFISFYALFYLGSWSYIPALVVIGLTIGRSGWVMHEAGHYSLYGKSSVDLRIQEFVFGLFCGMSAGWWRNQHNKHHCAPQKLKHDVDLETLPLIAFHKKIAKAGRNSAFVRVWLPFQAFLFPLVTCGLVAFGWQLFLHPRHMIRRRLKIEMMWVVLRHILTCVIGWYGGFTLAQILFGYCLTNFVGGLYLFGNFTVSHSHLPVVEPHDHRHWVEYAANHTINITPSYLCNWWMGYLNFQIEHHLFPCAPQYRFAYMWPRFKQFFEENNLPYHVVDYWKAQAMSFKNMHVVGNLDLDKID